MPPQQGVPTTEKLMPSGCDDLLFLLGFRGQAIYQERIINPYVGDDAPQGKRHADRGDTDLPQRSRHAML